jgi:hypothetical protein
MHAAHIAAQDVEWSLAIARIVRSFGNHEAVSVRDDIWMALQDAIGWQMGLVDSWGRKTPEGMEALEQAKRYRAILRRRYGTDKTEFDAQLDRAKRVSIYDLRANLTPKRSTA